MTHEGKEEHDMNVGGYDQTKSACKVLCSEGVNLDAISGGVHENAEYARGWVGGCPPEMTSGSCCIHIKG